MGDVYLAKHRRMEREVALKTLPAAMTQDQNAIRRFQREVQAAAKLSHPNVVTAFDADEANGVHFFVMEYVAGIDLSECVKTGHVFCELRSRLYFTGSNGLSICPQQRSHSPRH